MLGARDDTGVPAAAGDGSYRHREAGRKEERAQARPLRRAARTSAAAAERVFHMLDEPSEAPDREDAADLSDVIGQVDAEHIDFSYVEGKQILKDFTMKATHGTVNAIVGPTGAGKTTVINLLMRFYDPQSGTIRVDG